MTITVLLVLHQYILKDNDFILVGNKHYSFRKTTLSILI